MRIPLDEVRQRLDDLDRRYAEILILDASALKIGAVDHKQ